MIVAIDWSPAKTIIDLVNGIALHQVGLYAEQFEEAVLHVFIPINHHCTNSPNFNLCEYFQPKDPSIMEIGTILSPKHSIRKKYNRSSISSVAATDIERILSHRQLEKFISRTKSIMYYLDNNFYVANNVNKMNSSKHSFDSNVRVNVHHTINPAILALKQVFNERIGYEFLTIEQIAEVLTLPLLYHTESFDSNDIRKNMGIFEKMILGQSVYALKSCSITKDEILVKSSACLAISTVFQRLSVQSSSVYTVYRLIPLPIVFNGQKYVYTNLPDILGVNLIDKKVVQWTDKEFTSTCISSKIVSCDILPITLSLSSVSCISSILGISQESVSKCEVTRSIQSQPSIMHIAHDVWLFYSNDESYKCRFHPTKNDNLDMISITEPSIIRLPCDRKIHCSNIVLPSVPCENTTVFIKTINNTQTDKYWSSIKSMKTVAQRLVNIYETTARNSFTELESKMGENQYSFTNLLEEFLSVIISIILVILFIILTFILRSLKAKIQKHVNKIQVDINKLEAQYIDNLLLKKP